MHDQTTIRISPATIPVSLLQKHSTSAPRYTSYPTAPQFSSEFELSEVQEVWKEALHSSEHPLSLYLHIPFCAKRCLFCGCFTEVGSRWRKVAGEYVEALLQEADSLLSYSSKKPIVKQFALGGGTPNYLSLEQMQHLLSELHKRVDFADDAERSIELDPRILTIPYLDMLIDEGFNRFSFGIQDLDPQVQKYISCQFPYEQLEAFQEHLQSRGIHSLNIDLIYGLPGQTVETFTETIEKIKAVRPSRIALFGYAHVPWMKGHQKALERYHLPTPEERTAIFGMAYEALEDAGYEPIGIDHFALPEDPLIHSLHERRLNRNFMGYTTHRGLELVGLGASAISSVGTSYTQNLKSIHGYIERVTKGESTWDKALLLHPEDTLRRTVITELFCNLHLRYKDIQSLFGVDFAEHFATELQQLEDFAEEGLLSMDEEELTISEMGRFFVRNICMLFDQYLPSRGRETRYSRTI